jgi:N-acetyl-1-D-myo-inositol-2-amino-2-deoxy-alpha-D-glucopyranoside deacetylase
MEQQCLLAAFAHPDDEAFGTAGVFRKYRDEGARTALVCATRGEEGEISDPALATPETLGQVREQELREACRIIGVEDLSVLDYRDGSLAQADPTEATGRLVRQIRRVRGHRSSSRSTPTAATATAITWPSTA